MQQLDNKSIEVNNKIIRVDVSISKILEYKDIFVILIREQKEIPNNIIAYDYSGQELWKINDIVQAKVLRGYDQIEKKSDDILVAHYELGIIFEIDVTKRQIIEKTYLRQASNYVVFDNFDRILSHINGKSIDTFLKDEKCLQCGSKEFESNLIEPEQFTDIEIPQISHEFWKKLSNEDKYKKTKMKLREMKYIQSLIRDLNYKISICQEEALNTESNSKNIERQPKKLKSVRK